MSEHLVCQDKPLGPFVRKDRLNRLGVTNDNVYCRNMNLDDLKDIQIQCHLYATCQHQHCVEYTQNRVMCPPIDYIQNNCIYQFIKNRDKMSDEYEKEMEKKIFECNLSVKKS